MFVCIIRTSVCWQVKRKEMEKPSVLDPFSSFSCLYFLSELDLFSFFSNPVLLPSLYPISLFLYSLPASFQPPTLFSFFSTLFQLFLYFSRLIPHLTSTAPSVFSSYLFPAFPGPALLFLLPSSSSCCPLVSTSLLHSLIPFPTLSFASRFTSSSVFVRFVGLHSFLTCYLRYRLSSSTFSSSATSMPFLLSGRINISAIGGVRILSQLFVFF